MKKILFILLTYCLVFNAFSQDDDGINLDAQQLEDFKRKAKEKVNYFQDYVSLIGDKSTDAETRKFFVEETIKVFVPNSRMQVSSVDRMQKKWLKMEQYLDRLGKLQYSKVEITAYDSPYISNFRSRGDGTYVAVASFFQKFTGYNAEGQPIYEDYTNKTFEIILKTQDSGFGDEVWIVLLGDIRVEETLDKYNEIVEGMEDAKDENVYSSHH